MRRLSTVLVAMLLFFLIPLGGLMAISWAVGLVAPPLLTEGNWRIFVAGQFGVACGLTWLLGWKFPVL